MIIIGADFHPEFQQIAFVDMQTGELQERRLKHPGVAETFYRELAAGGVPVRVGMEASGHARWFERQKIRSVCFSSEWPSYLSASFWTARKWARWCWATRKPGTLNSTIIQPTTHRIEELLPRNIVASKVVAC